MHVLDGIKTKNDDEKSIEELFLEITKNCSIPIIKIGELGHNVENYVFPIGSIAELDTNQLTLNIERPTFSNLL